MKNGVFKLNMHPKDYFDRNPFGDDGKGPKPRPEEKERPKSAPSDKKPFKYSSPGKKVRCIFDEFITDNTAYFHRLVAGWEQRWRFRKISKTQ